METKDKKRDDNTEATILKCAEEVFLERGFDGAKTTEIAKRAGVNHAMIHYYFRTKKNLFNVIFEEKISLLASSFSASFAQDIPFFDKVRHTVETHFDFIAENPRLLMFLYTEIVNDDERKQMMATNILPKAKGFLDELEKGIAEEISKGTIRDIRPIEVLLNIIALNVTTFLAFPLMEVVLGKGDEVTRIMAERKESNVDFIINGMKSDTPKPKYTQTSLSFDF